MTSRLRGTKVRALTSMRVLRDPFYWMEKWRNTYGDPFLLQTLNGPVVMTGRPEVIKQIFLAKAGTQKPFALENSTNYIGENALILQYGRAHSASATLRLFHGKRMKSLCWNHGGSDQSTSCGTWSQATFLRCSTSARTLASRSS